MMDAIQLLRHPAWQRLALALLQFLWQGAAVAAVAVALVRLLALRSGPPRYVAYLLALVVMAACPVVTFCLVQAPVPTGLSPKPQDHEAMRADVPEWTVTHAPAPPARLITPAPAVVPEVAPTPAAAEAPAVPGQSARASLPRRLSAVLPWLTAGWLIGVLALSVRLLLGVAGMHRWRRRVEALPAHAADAVATLAGRMGLGGFARVFASPLATGPVVVGCLRPMVLLPAAMLTSLPPEMLEAVIAHELAHVRRLDLWANLFQRLVETVLFYHPAVWWLSRRLREERELCCDELAVAATGRPLEYATALERSYRSALGANQPSLAAGLGAGNRSVLVRVRHVLGLVPSPAPSRWWPAGALVLLAALAVIVAMGISYAAETDEKQAPDQALEARISELIDRLGGPTHKEREEAQKELVEIGVAAVPALEKAAKDANPERSAQARVILERVMRISGVVTDEGGKPLAGATVRLLNPEFARSVPRGERVLSYGPSRVSGPLLIGQVLTDHAGGFGFRNLPIGKTDILVEKDRSYRTAILRGVPTGRVGMAVRLGKPCPYRLSGLVVDPAGRPVAGATVALVERECRIPGPPPKLTTVPSNADGRFRFPDLIQPLLPDQRLSPALFVRAKGLGFWAKELDCTGGEEEVTVRLTPPARVTGSVVDPDGKGVAGAKVVLDSLDCFDGFCSLREYPQGAPTALTDEKGAFVLTGLPSEGVARMTAECRGYERKLTASVALGSGEGAPAMASGRHLGPPDIQAGNPLPVTLRPAAILRGRAVFEGSDKPAAGLTMATQGVKDSAWSQAQTAQDGTFELPNVTPGTCNLLVLFDCPDKSALPEWAAAATTIADLQSGQVREGLKVVLTKGGIVEGRITDAKGHPLRGIDVAFYSAARPRPGAGCQSTLTRPDGTWSYRFPPGEVYVYVEGRNPNLGPWRPGARTIQLKSGQVLDGIDFQLGVELPESSPHRAPATKTAPPSRSP
ncbi:MAG TPA: M56 family metallopeptidase [Phycisphaerae bacterium]|nr:M56 family metallopeptidase [Phycisphaerae bacterium]